MGLRTSSELVTGQRENCLFQASAGWFSRHLHDKCRWQRPTKHHANASRGRIFSRVEPVPAGSFYSGEVGDAMGRSQTEQSCSRALTTRINAGVTSEYVILITQLDTNRGAFQKNLSVSCLSLPPLAVTAVWHKRLTRELPSR